MLQFFEGVGLAADAMLRGESVKQSIEGIPHHTTVRNASASVSGYCTVV